MDNTIRALRRVLKPAIVLCLIVGLVSGPAYAMGVWTVDDGEYGVMIDDGEVTRVVGPGNHFYVPGLQKMETVKQTYTQQTLVRSETADGRDVEVAVRVSYDVPRSGVDEMYQHTRGDSRLIDSYVMNYCGSDGYASVALEITQHNASTLMNQPSVLSNTFSNACSLTDRNVEVVSIQFSPREVAY